MDCVDHVVGHIDDLLGPYSQRLEDLSDGLWECRHLIKTMTSKVQAVTLEVFLLKEAESIPLGTQEGSSRVKVPELSPFNGPRSAKTLENFL